MNKRFWKLGKHAARAFFLLALCGTTYSCKDDYIYDDGNPSWLGSSIYEYLESQGDYTNFVRLIDDLEYKEVLARTGSKTIFVANDDAFNAFYKDNAWGVSSYDQLTRNQKKLLLNSVMINNAYLLEMMSSTAATGDDNATPNSGECLRRETAADVTDSITFLNAADIPMSYNENDKDYWSRFRDKGIYLALDATAPMMTHFIAAQMSNKHITNDDFFRLTGRTREAKDAFIYDSRVVKQDITCQNGYVNCLDKVLLSPQNMAEVLRTNGRTNIFSHMIDRFSAPFYNASITERYRLIFGENVDSVFQKRYFSKRSQGGNELANDQGTNPAGEPIGNAVTYALSFDPGWNTYASKGYDKEQDMGAIFAPIDKSMMEYFFSLDGGGRFLINEYAPDFLDRITPETTDLSLVYQAIDQIPLEVIEALLNNLMKDSFVGSVPSKFETIKNDAQDPMFDEEYDYHRNKVTDVLMANNGVIYLMDEVIAPALYAAVSAPAYVEKDKQIFNWAIRRGDKIDPNTKKPETLGGIAVNYYAYLLAMSARFSFFVPTDENFLYVDPLSFRSADNNTIPGTLIGRAYLYKWSNTNPNDPIEVESYKYNYNLATGTGTLGDKINESLSSTAMQNRLKDMLETHTIVHQDESDITGIDETATGMECNKHYFLSKNYAPIYANNAEARNNKNGMTVQGGMQVVSGEVSNVTGFDDKSAQTNGYGNGYAYAINSPMIPTIESVYSVLYNTPEFNDFLALCEIDEDVLKEINIPENELSRYRIFEYNGGLPCYDKTTGAPLLLTDHPTNVRFLSNYQYTLYVPTNEAMQEAHKRGLPTWDDVRNFLQLDNNDRPELSPEDSLKAAAMATTIVNFVKNHFQDKSIFADTNTILPTAFETATINSETNLYCRVEVQGGAGRLTVKSNVAGAKPVSVTDKKNIIARDYITRSNGTGGTASNALPNADASPSASTLNINASSSIVIHGIDGVLDHKAYTNGRYDSDWATGAKARNYLKKFRLVK